MNKKIHFILFPILLLAFSLISWKNNSVFFRQGGTELSISNCSVNEGIPFSLGVTHNDTHKIKNAIRVKARHDAAAIEISSVSFPELSAPHYEGLLTYGTYRAYWSSTSSSTLSLRGPPVV